MNKILMVVVLLFAGFAQAQAVDYKRLSEVQKAKLVNFTCSSTSTKYHFHLTGTIEDRTLTALSMISVTPALGVTTRTFSEADLKELTYDVQKRSIGIRGILTGRYFPEHFTFFMAENLAGLYGNIAYTDGDGGAVKRSLICGATNYRLPLR